MRVSHAIAMLAVTSLVATAPSYALPRDASELALPEAPSVAVPSEASPEDALATVDDLFNGDASEAAAARTARHAHAEGRIDATLALVDLLRVLPDLAPADRARAEKYFLRPSSKNGDGIVSGYGKRAGKVKRICNKNLCVHSVRKTANKATAGQARDTLKAAQTSWSKIVTKGGYRKPLNDKRSRNDGGNGKLDVYLANLGSRGLFGYCTTDDPKAFNPSLRFSAYCVVDNDFGEFGKSQKPIDFRRVTVAHEFFHAVQFAYEGAEDRWFSEGTAAWVEDEVYDKINDNLFYLGKNQPNPIRRPNVPLDVFSASSYPNYGTWVFWKKLSETFPKRNKKGGLPVIIRQVWEKAANIEAEGASTFALRDVLADRGRDFGSFFASFATGNRFPKASYSEGKNYPIAPLAGRATLTPSSPVVSLINPIEIDHLASATIRLKPQGLGDVDLAVAVDGPPGVTSPFATVVVHKKAGGRTITPVPLDGNGNGTVQVDFAPSRVSHVEITLANASIRFSGCYPASNPSPFTCQGTATDDAELFDFTATVVN